MDGAEGGRTGTGTGWRRRSQVCGMWRSATPLSPRDKLETVPSNGKLSPLDTSAWAEDSGQRGWVECGGGNDSPACRLRSE